MTTRELRLAMAVMALVICGGGWLAFLQMSKWRKELDDRDYKLSQQRVEAEELLRQKDFWNARQAWLDQKQPAYPARNEADNQIYELVDQTAKKQGLTVLRQLGEPEEQPGMVSSTVIVEAKGPFEKVQRWLYDLQKPEAFVSVKGITLKSNPEDTALVIVSDMKVQKWFRATPK